MSRVEQQLVETRGEVKEARADVREISVALQGPPREGSIRARIHELEGHQAAAKAAEAALEMARQIRDERGQRRFTRGEKIAGLLLALAALSLQLLTVLAVLNHT